jgi:enediyne biosynthesis protein E4
LKLFLLLVLSSALFAQVQQAGGPPPIRFEDATAKSGIQFTHNFGSQKLGSLLESTGAGCVWFDYNNDGFPDLYVASGKPLEGGIHPYPLKQLPVIPPHNHLYRNNGDGTFTDVTDKAGVAANIYGMAARSRPILTTTVSLICSSPDTAKRFFITITATELLPM